MLVGSFPRTNRVLTRYASLMMKANGWPVPEMVCNEFTIPRRDW